MSDNDTRKQRSLFWRKFLRLTRGRVPVSRALAVIGEEERDAGFQAIIRALQRTIEGGAPLSEGLAQHPEEFSAAVRELVRTAEKTGAWDDILVEIADGISEGTFA